MRAKVLGGLCVFIMGAGSSWTQQPEQRIDSIQGPVLYQAYCAVCHGKDAKGNGPMAKNLRTAPSDLTRYAARRGGNVFRAEMRRIIKGENDAQSMHGTREMPVWGPIFSEVGPGDRDMGEVRIDNLIRYIESLQVN